MVTKVIFCIFDFLRVHLKEKGSIRYYGKPGCDILIRVDYHGSKEVPTGTCRAILKDAGIKK
ncbi:MAG: type II toxin-antitoxin system HicA family toxin [Deltaproteobacteria bacterium]|nr:type II toxin-antitoxin system HicA family toxin [Deltaproteobacteria bacterium]